MNVSGESRAAAMLCDEEISDGGEGRYETLQTSGWSVTLHLVLPFSQWQMRILRSGPVFDRWHEVTFGRTIGAEFVGDDPLGWHALFFSSLSSNRLAALVSRRL